MKHLALVVMLVSAAALGAPKKKGPPPPPPPVTEPTLKVTEALGDTVLGFVINASKVQAWRVADSGGLRPEASKAIGSDFVRGAAGSELDAKALEALRSVLYDDKSYRFEADVSKCRFVPHLSFQLQVGLDTLEALVSFSCNEVLFYVGKQGGRWVPQGTFDVKPARKKLLELAKATLPQDKETQNLK
ncbi:MAG: hypothetical protein U0228_06685 [Myxococcaceae bacterium]